MEALESSSTGPFNPMEIKYGTIICFLKCRTNDQNRRCSKISRAEKSRGCGNNSFCYGMAADTVQPNKGLLPLCVQGREQWGTEVPWLCSPGDRAARATLPLQQQPATAHTEPATSRNPARTSAEHFPFHGAPQITETVPAQNVLANPWLLITCSDSTHTSLN